VCEALGLPIVEYGCGMYCFVSLAEPGNPVRLWDPAAIDAYDDPPER
jgi:hypothetical protein